MLNQYPAAAAGTTSLMMVEDQLLMALFSTTHPDVNYNNMSNILPSNGSSSSSSLSPPLHSHEFSTSNYPRHHHCHQHQALKASFTGILQQPSSVVAGGEEEEEEEEEDDEEEEEEPDDDDDNDGDYDHANHVKEYNNNVRSRHALLMPCANPNPGELRVPSLSANTSSDLGGSVAPPVPQFLSLQRTNLWESRKSGLNEGTTGSKKSVVLDGGDRRDDNNGNRDQNHHEIAINSDDDDKNRKKNGIGALAPVQMKKSSYKVKAGRRRVREPRFCFKTLSDVDVLDDGYKWRKYGQKVVKNTQHPRSYYRCTQDKCRVKKRVERLAEDPRMVITTYEGRHVHSPSRDNEGDDHNPNYNNASTHFPLLLNNFFW